MMKNNKSNLISWLFGVGLAAFALVGCSGGGGSASDADPSGYYDVSGRATVKADDNTTDMEISNLQAMVDMGGDSSRIMMMGTGKFDGNDARFLYDGTITSLTQNSFTADFTIYTTESVLAARTDGQNPVTATASGTISEGSSITGTLVGSGVGNGTFSLTYTESNNQAADILRIENGVDTDVWIARIGGSAGAQEFKIDNAGMITHVASSAGGGIFRGCEMDGTITPINTTSLYDVSVTLATCDAGGGLPDGDYTGLAASRTQTTADDTLVFAVTNGTYSPNGDFE